MLETLMEATVSGVWLVPHSIHMHFTCLCFRTDFRQRLFWEAILVLDSGPFHVSPVNMVPQLIVQNEAY